MLHIFTIVLNGMPFIREHKAIFDRLSIPWTWHVVEGVANPVHCTCWCAKVRDSDHRKWLSNDGTTEYLDSIAGEQVKVYRNNGKPWEGKMRMCNAPLVNIPVGSVLHEQDVDEFWTHRQLETIYKLFTEGGAGRAWYWCDYYLGPNLHMINREHPGNNPNEAWIRTWKRAAGEWSRHEPPSLPCRGREVKHAETEAMGLVFKHFAYTTEAQLRFKEHYYRYGGALSSWRNFQSNQTWPACPGDYFGWMGKAGLVDHTEDMMATIRKMQTE